MSLPADLCLGFLDQLLSRAEGLTEVLGPDGGPWDDIKGPQGESVGLSRLWVGDGKIRKVAYYGGWVPAIDMDTHMVFAFTDPESPVPHFTLDSVHVNVNAFHLDLIPRADVATHLKYMDYVYGPITELFQEGKSLDGLSAATIGPRQRSIMSQWMLAYRASDDAFKQLNKYVGGYLDHWFRLLDEPWPQEVLDDIKDTDLPERDFRNRSLIFNRDVDEVWNQIEPLFGWDRTELQRLNLLHNEFVAEVPKA